MARTKLRTLLDSTTTESSTLPCHDSAQTATSVAAASTRTESEGSEVQVISIRPCQTQRLLKPPKLTFPATLAGGTIAPGIALCRSERLLADCLRPAPHRLHTTGSVVRRPVSPLYKQRTVPSECLPTDVPNQPIGSTPTSYVNANAIRCAFRPRPAIRCGLPEYWDSDRILAVPRTRRILCCNQDQCYTRHQDHRIDKRKS